MNAVRKIAKNSIFIFIARGIEISSNLLLTVIITRYLGVENFGKYSFIMAIIWVLSPLISLGLPQILCREIAKEKEKAANFLGTTWVINAFIVPLLLLIVLATAFFTKLETVSTVALLIATGFFVLRILHKFIISLFTAYEAMEYDTISTFVIRLAELLCIAVAVLFDLGFLSLFIAIGVADTLGLLSAVFMLKKWFVLPRLAINFEQIRYMLKEALPLAFVDLYMLLFVYVDIFVLKIFTTEFEIGLFQSSQKIFLGFLPVPVSISVALLPLMSSLTASDSSLEKLRGIYTKVFKFFLIISLIIAIPGAIFSENIIRFLFGVEFLDAAVVMRILFFALPFLFLSTFTRTTLVALNRQKYLFSSGWICVLANLILDLLLVPKYGYVGAGIGTLMASVILAAINIYFLLVELKEIYVFKIIAIPTVSACIVGLIFYKFAHLNVLLSVLGYLITYLGTLFIFKAFSVEEITLLKQLVAK
jgi:O-antigen/teichoic acid export membrane protein